MSNIQNKEDFKKIEESVFLSIYSFIILTLLIFLGACYITIKFNLFNSNPIFLIIYLISLVTGIFFLLSQAHKIDIKKIDRIEKDKLFFDFIGLTSIKEKDKLLIQYDWQLFLSCIERLTTSIAIISILFLILKLDIEPNDWISCIIQFIAFILFPFIGSFFVFHTFLKIIISITMYLFKVNEIPHHTNDDKTNSNYNYNEIKNLGYLNLIHEKRNLRLKFTLDNFCILLKSSLIPIILISLISMTWQIAIKLTP